MRFRFSGHESFPCRYTWLPKAYLSLRENPTVFSDENEAMVQLGVGKNMVRAIRFWVQLAGIAQPLDGQAGLSITPFGHAIFHPHGFDPYLEDVRTLWLIHWKFCSHVEEPMFAWYFMLNQWAEPELSRSELLRAFKQEATKQDRALSDTTLSQHLDIFLHTYLPARGKKGEVLEDNLDCPLTELNLLLPAGERLIEFVDGRRHEPVYAFRRDRKPEITGPLLAYCLHDFWRQNRPHEASLTFREVAVVPGSVGQLFKLSEQDLRDRLESLGPDSQGLLEYRASAALPRVLKSYEWTAQSEAQLLANVYQREVTDYIAVPSIQPQEAVNHA
ncbi:DUF4007 family protein [Hymenobacter armeniacus]|uniref:DUF4007 family protein n=1 Tax=Hymenobacter armeniacus TaxID=2771358 RepID=A0ABR8JTY8_9BACT|nr:DUF4007 family protein [Hymenobacter armeniacus]MBD2722223.1 DUF4007 family protein [Hymenobacter armeniacus]